MLIHLTALNFIPDESFIEYLADYVQEEFEKQYGPSLEELRLNLTGVPKELREKLFEFLSSDSRNPYIEKEGVRHLVPVYLFDEDIADPKDCPKLQGALKAGGCGQ